MSGGVKEFSPKPSSRPRSRRSSSRNSRANGATAPPPSRYCRLEAQELMLQRAQLSPSRAGSDHPHELNQFPAHRLRTSGCSGKSANPVHNSSFIRQLSWAIADDSHRFEQGLHLWLRDLGDVMLRTGHDLLLRSTED